MMERDSYVHSKRRSKIKYMTKDWPENVIMDAPLFAEYAAEIEKEDFEDEVRNMCSTVVLLIAARRETIKNLYLGADYLDSIWMRCRVSKTMGTSVSVVGGGLTIAGGILTTLTVGVAAPLLIAGIATSSVGAVTKIGTSVAEKILNSKQVKEMNEAFARDKEITGKFERQLEDIKRYKESTQLCVLYYSMKECVGENHLLLPVFKSVLNTIDNDEDARYPECLHSQTPKSFYMSDNLHPRATSLIRQDSKSSIQTTPVNSGVFVEGGKVIGQNSFRVAGQVVIGISAAFIVWDAIELGFSISDLVKKQGSQAAKVLREKADILNDALEETIGTYNIQMPE